MPDLEPGARAQLAEVARRHGVRLLVAFGSQVSGRTHAASDLDLAVLVDPQRRGDPMRLLADLQALFPRRPVDLVWLDRADPLLGWYALRRPWLLFGERSELVRRQVYAWRRFVEYRPYFEREAEAVRRGIARWVRAHG
jgi:predicted nucleotidyltransferase